MNCSFLKIICFSIFIIVGCYPNQNKLSSISMNNKIIRYKDFDFNKMEGKNELLSTDNLYPHLRVYKKKDSIKIIVAFSSTNELDYFFVKEDNYYKSFREEYDDDPTFRNYKFEFVFNDYILRYLYRDVKENSKPESRYLYKLSHNHQQRIYEFINDDIKLAKPSPSIDFEKYYQQSKRVSDIYYYFKSNSLIIKELYINRKEDEIKEYNREVLFKQFPYRKDGFSYFFHSYLSVPGNP